MNHIIHVSIAFNSVHIIRFREVCMITVRYDHGRKTKHATVS